MSDRLSCIDAAVEAIAQGKIIIVMDDEDRENEGDFICAAEKVTPEIVNFMITHGRGQTCMPILPETAKRLDLPLMVEREYGPVGDEFYGPRRSSRLPNGNNCPGTCCDDSGYCRSYEHAGRFCAARASLSPDCQRGRCLAPGWAHRGKYRSCSSKRLTAGRHAL